MLLYIHVPFCRKRCNYCAFYSTVLPSYNEDMVLEAYCKTLLAEIEFWKEKLNNKDGALAEVETIFFGGGTPSILPIKILKRIIKLLRSSFNISNSAEISFESNPESLLKYGYAEDLKGLGINRLSIGVQSLDDGMLQLLGRPHSSRQAIAAYEAARICGFSNINLDFIWALPEQRLRLWLEQLKAVVKLKPDHLSCYSLTLEEGTPFEHLYNSGKFAPTSEKEQANMYLHGVGYLESEGFLHYEISNFARMGYECRHNLGYWEGKDYLGLGPSASSTLQGKRWKNPSSLKGWSDAISQNNLGYDAENIDSQTKLLEYAMLSLRTSRGLNLSTYRDMSGRNFLQDAKQLLAALRQNRLIKVHKNHINLTTEGMLVSNSILEHAFRVVEESLNATSRKI